MDAKVCPNGSSVGRTAPNCDFAPCPVGVSYKNYEYGFNLSLPNAWSDYKVIKQSWQGRTVDTGKVDYTGVEVIIKNPQTTPTQAWQDIPVMVFTPDVWKLISEEKVAVSAAPIPPEKIGENAKYVFATPPRWYGFTDDKGWQEAVDAVKSFKAF